MKDYISVPTSAEVFAVIRARHPELVVYGSASSPEGTYYKHLMGRMYTSYGFKDSDFPLVEAETTWDIDPENTYVRKNVQQKYWICIGKKEEM